MTISRNREKIALLLAQLEAFAFNVSALQEELKRKLDEEENGTPNADDLRYTIPSDVRTWESYRAEQNPVLDSSNAYQGWQYELTPGQREWLKSRYGLTPAKTVTLVELSVWKGTNHPRELVIRSNEHVNPALRKHTLVMARVTCAGTFFRESAELDAAREEGQLCETEQEVTSSSSSNKKNVVKSVDIEKMMEELEKEFS